MHLAARWVQLSSLGVRVWLPADEGLTSAYRCILNLFPPHSYTFSQTTQTSYVRPLPDPATGGLNQGTMSDASITWKPECTGILLIPPNAHDWDPSRAHVPISWRKTQRLSQVSSCCQIAQLQSSKA